LPLVLYDISSSYLERGADVRWHGMAIAATTGRIGCRSSMACCARVRACRWRSRCSTATPPTR
jgi:hypothetical protein